MVCLGIMNGWIDGRIDGVFLRNILLLWVWIGGFSIRSDDEWRLVVGDVFVKLLLICVVDVIKKS